MTNLKDIPIAVITYNRASHVRLALEALASCTGFGEHSVYVFCDGAKTIEDQASVEESRVEVRSWAKNFPVTVVERDGNWGLARSVVAAVTQLCEQYGWVIVIEDDLIVATDFLKFVGEGLRRYVNDPRVYQVSGYNFPIEHRGDAAAYFLPLTTSWGWGTWRRSWNRFSWQALGVEAMLSDHEQRLRFDLDGAYPFAEIMRKALAGQVDSWGILWKWAVYREKGLVLYPSKSLVWVGGFDGTGTHCGVVGDKERKRREQFRRLQRNQTSLWPSDVAADSQGLDEIQRFLRDPRRSGSMNVPVTRRGWRASIGWWKN